MNLVSEMNFDKCFERLLKAIGGVPLLQMKWDAEEGGEEKMFKFLDVFERKVSALEGNYGMKSFNFRDNDRRTVLYQYILEFHTDEDVDGTPLLILNDFPPFIKGEKQNPVLHLVLRYEDVEIRDEDYELLKICRK